MEETWPMICGAGSNESGSWWLRIFGYGIILKAPWNAPLFSERYGHKKFYPIGFGWRFSVLRVHKRG